MHTLETVMAMAEHKLGVSLRRKTRREACGGCPFCGTGVDRFIVWADGGYWCRQCGTSGRLRDVGKFVPYYVPPVKIEPPSETWRERALFHWQRSLHFLSGMPMSYLQSRGLTNKTIAEFKLGYNPINTLDAPSLWGFDDHREVFIPTGIVIPWFVDGDIWMLKIRRFGAKHKYGSPRGGKVCLWGRFTGKDTLLLCEGEFDMMVAWQEAGDLVDVGTMGGMNVLPKGRWLKQVVEYDRVLIAYDMDNDEYKHKLARHIGPKAEVLTWSGAKDLNDYLLAGKSVRTLVEKVL